jgi:hypothetical protein
MVFVSVLWDYTHTGSQLVALQTTLITFLRKKNHTHTDAGQYASVGGTAS